MTRSTGTLSRLVGDERRFAETQWGRRPLLRERADDFSGLLDLADVDHLVTETMLRLPGMRMVRGGRPIPSARYTRTIRIGGRPVRETIRPERVVQLFAGGATIVLQALHRQWGPVARFCRDLELDLTHPVQANAYVTPATAQGFAVHHDTHDVFVIQTHGSKAWRIYEPLVELPHTQQKWSRDLGDPGEPLIERELEAGDVLYIPRGFPHEASAREVVSVHLTVGVNAKTWLDVWASLFDAAHEHPAFRESLPVGFARDADGLAAAIGGRIGELEAWMRKAADAEAAERFVRGFWEARRPLVDGALRQVADLPRLGPSSLLRPRAGTVWDVRPDADRVVVSVGKRRVSMPAFCEPALRALADGRAAAGELPGLDPESGVVLARRLVREGVLEVVDAGG